MLGFPADLLVRFLGLVCVHRWVEFLGVHALKSRTKVNLTHLLERAQTPVLLKSLTSAGEIVARPGFDPVRPVIVKRFGFHLFTYFRIIKLF